MSRNNKTVHETKIDNTLQFVHTIPNKLYSHQHMAQNLNRMIATKVVERIKF